MNSKSHVRISSKPTVNDLARHAGVSLATVDRVLNARPGVRRVTIERVNKAVDEIGYIRDTAAANLARRRVYRFEFLLPDIRSEFVDALQFQIDAQSAALSTDRIFLHTNRVKAFDSQSIVLALDATEPESVNGVALIAPETPAVRDAIGRARDRGVVVVALLSDLPSSSRDHFVGIDNNSAGQTAARLMGRFIKGDAGSILMLTNSRLARDHLERRHGFDRVMSSCYPELKVLPTVELRDDTASAEKVLPEVLRNCPDLKGIYTSDSSNGSLIDFLCKTVAKPVVIAHDLTPISRKALEQGVFDALISQDSGHIVRSAVHIMRATLDTVPYNEMLEQIKIEIFLKENLPSA